MHDSVLITHPIPSTFPNIENMNVVLMSVSGSFVVLNVLSSMNKSGRIKDLGVKRGKEESKPFERLGGVVKDKKKEGMEEKKYIFKNWKSS